MAVTHSSRFIHDLENSCILENQFPCSDNKYMIILKSFINSKSNLIKGTNYLIINTFFLPMVGMVKFVLYVIYKKLVFLREEDI